VSKRSTVLVLLATVAVWTIPARAQRKERPDYQLELGAKDKVLVRLTKEIAGLAYSPDGNLLAFAGGDSLIHVWDFKANKELAAFKGHTGFIRTVAFSPDGKLIASAGDDPNVFVWDVATGKELRRVGQHKNNLRMSEFSPDGKLIVSSGFDNKIGLWDATTGKQMLLFDAHPRVPYSVAFSPDGKILASGGDHDSNIRLWDAATGKPIRNWDAHPGTQQSICIYTVAFSHDGRLLASGGGDGSARVWETLTGKEVLILEGHSGGVSRVAFAKDGRTIATASHDHDAFLWETATGRQIRKFGQHKRWVWGLAYSPLNPTVATAGDDGDVVLWDIGKGMTTPDAPAKEITDAELADAWRDLAGAEARKAFDAANRMSASRSDLVIDYLRDRLHPVKTFDDPDKVKGLIGQLDHPMFRVREQATRELTQLGEQIESLLRTALASNPPSEARQRIEALVATFEKRDLNPDQLRAVRALRVLEQLNTPASRKLLDDLAAGAPGVRLTSEAAAAAKRLEASDRPAK
jgi:roadblock/LC7 domain-containing protein